MSLQMFKGWSELYHPSACCQIKSSRWSPMAAVGFRTAPCFPGLWIVHTCMNHISPGTGNALAIALERLWWRRSSLHKAGRRKDDTQLVTVHCSCQKSLPAVPLVPSNKQPPVITCATHPVLKDVHTFVPIHPLGGTGIQNLHFHWCVPLVCVLKWYSVVLFFSKR